MLQFDTQSHCFINLQFNIINLQCFILSIIIFLLLHWILGFNAYKRILCINIFLHELMNLCNTVRFKFVKSG